MGRKATIMLVIAVILLLIALYDTTSESSIFSRVTAVAKHYPLSPISIQDTGYQLITFATPVIDADTTVTGNVSICCRYTPPKDPYDAPSVFILSASDYSAWQNALDRNQLNAFPSTSPNEATTFGSLGNYTYDGASGAEFVTINFSTKETSVYYFLVIGKGENSFTLNLIVRHLQTTHPYEWILWVATAGAMIGSAYLGWTEGAKPIQVEPIEKGKADEDFMRIAIELSKESKPEDDRVHPKVGVVVVKEGKIVERGFRGQFSKGDHAEYTVLERKLAGTDLTGTTLYTTLEPCTARGHEKIPCADRIVMRGIGRVVIGMLDPNPSIQGKGMYKLDKAGVRVQLAERLTSEIKELNKDFIAAQEKLQPSTDREFYKKLTALLSRLVLRWQNYKGQVQNLKWTPEAIEDIKNKFSSDKETLLSLISHEPEIDLEVKAQTNRIVDQIDAFVFFKIDFKTPYSVTFCQLQNFEHQGEQVSSAAQTLRDLLHIEIS
jgi:pyrimidine deaminase RibD-like protein